jgi:hypothetical protein
MKQIILFIFLISLSAIIFSQSTPKTDPYHLKDGGFGYGIITDPSCSVWWAEGSYKVMRDTPLPKKKDGEVKMWSAKNEYESFILVVKPGKRMDNFRVSLAELKDPSGNKISGDNITVRKVEYVMVTKPTDSYAYAGWWPDPLPVYDVPETITPSENHPFWITVKVPESALAGIYKGELNLSSPEWNLKVPISLQVWDFSLPHSPTMRSGFGMDIKNIAKYENLNSREEEIKVFDLYMQSFRDYKISPYDPFEFTPIKEEINGIAWSGGFYDSKEKHGGTYSYKVVDNSATLNTEANSINLLPVNNTSNYNLIWYSKSLEDKQKYVAGLECYNAEKKLVVYENRFDIFTGTGSWKPDTLKLGRFIDEVKYVKIRIFPSYRTLTGENKGTVWFDDLSLLNTDTNLNEFTAGNFEVNLNEIDLKLDFTDFNNAGKRYFDDYGFTGYRLNLKGLGGGTFYSRQNGVFEGFEQGTDEYNKLMEKYLAQVQNNLEKNKWLGKEYIYWFDEPEVKDYPFVRETNALIKKYAPKITTFITEHISGQDITDVTDISCTIWHKLDHEKIRKLNERGLQHWSYLCTGPKSPWITEFIDHDAINLRMWLWGSWQHKLKGILIWETTYWNSPEASPVGYLQNPWEEAAAFVQSYGQPMGKQRNWGNGDGRLFYPLNRDPNDHSRTYIGKPVPSYRLELLRDGIEDYEYFVILEKAVKNAPANKSKIAREASEALVIPKNIYTDEKTYSKNPQDIQNYRKKIAEYVVQLSQK